MNNPKPSQEQIKELKNRLVLKAPKLASSANDDIYEYFYSKPSLEIEKVMNDDEQMTALTEHLLNLGGNNR
jgi:hypothetical protein